MLLFESGHDISRVHCEQTARAAAKPLVGPLRRLEPATQVMQRAVGLVRAKWAGACPERLGVFIRVDEQHPLGPIPIEQSVEGGVLRHVQHVEHGGVAGGPAGGHAEAHLRRLDKHAHLAQRGCDAGDE
eukprot:scaffold195574_cov26-Tisochrysis_lutea.AAC.4